MPILILVLVLGSSTQSLIGPLESSSTHSTSVYYVKILAATSQGYGDMSNVITIYLGHNLPNYSTAG